MNNEDDRITDFFEFAEWIAQEFAEWIAQQQSEVVACLAQVVACLATELEVALEQFLEMAPVVTQATDSEEGGDE